LNNFKDKINVYEIQKQLQTLLKGVHPTRRTNR